jgi:hypothetical protein
MLKALKTLVLALGLISTTVLASPTTGNVTIQPSIQEALQARLQVIKKPKLAAASAIGYDTYIIVINYTESPILVSFPTQQIQLTRLTAGRYQRENYIGPSYIELANANGVRFWSADVDYQNIVSVYISNGRYVVYNTH